MVDIYLGRMSVNNCDICCLKLACRHSKVDRQVKYLKLWRGSRRRSIFPFLIHLKFLSSKLMGFICHKLPDAMATEAPPYGI